VEGGGDPVRRQLAVGVEQRHRGVDLDAGPGHHLALERVAVDVDEAWGEEAVAQIGGARPGVVGADRDDQRALDRHGRRSDPAVGQQRAAASQPRHAVVAHPNPAAHRRTPPSPRRTLIDEAARRPPGAADGV
jgi:hypothetical protein